MKKNLRIVSAAAAALLAVAPVAATAVPAASTTVSAATDPVKNTTQLQNGGQMTLASAITPSKPMQNDQKFVKDGVAVINTETSIAKGTEVTIVNAPAGSNNAVISYKGADGKTYVAYVNQKALLDQVPAATTPSSSDKINAGASTIFDGKSNVALNISAVAKNGNVPSAINGNVVVTLGNNTYTALLGNDKDGHNVSVYYAEGKTYSTQDPAKMDAGKYYAVFNDVNVNLGNSFANTDQTLTLPQNAWFGDMSDFQKGNFTRTKKVHVDANGVAHLGKIGTSFWALNSADLQEVHFYSVKTGNVVTSGSVALHAVNGKLNVNSIYNALTYEYVASQLINGKNVETLLPVNDIKDQLEKQNIKVDPNGYFDAQPSISLTMNAKSNNNGATAQLPVTVTVDNVTPTAAQETTRTVKIMHIATIYDKNGKATHEPALRAYNTVSVVSEPVSLKDEKGNDAGKFYKLAGKDQYIKVGNVDGTSRSLKHNSYVYKSTGKRRGKTVLKKGSSVTTYGKSFMIAGHQMYRIGENQYVKKANF